MSEPVPGAPVDVDAAYLSTRALFAADSLLGWLRVAQRRLLLAGRRPATGRYVDVRDRPWATDLGLSRHLKDAIQRSKKNLAGEDSPPVHWKGVLHMKDPFSLATYPLVIQELQPRAVVEIGSYHGGSALWMADLLDLFGLAGTPVHSFDVNPGQVVVDDPRIRFHHADSNRTESFDADLLASLPHPWLLIEDAHVNVYELLGFLDRFLVPGDYVIVEDTQWPEFYSDLKRFLLDRGGRYLVDTRYADLFGYNVTWHMNGYVRKMRD